MTDNTLREALKKDFKRLYVKQFTTNWEAQRLIRSVEIDVMSLDNLKALLVAHTDEVLDKILSELPRKFDNYIGISMKDYLNGHNAGVEEVRAIIEKHKEESKK